MKVKRHQDRKIAGRNPQQSQQRILDAALAEFAAKGFAGARVDVIARTARINKRMLYHYFGDKEGLFREVLRRKITERSAWLGSAPEDPVEYLPHWFQLACRDRDWIRLLEWEALQWGDKKVIDEERRQESIGRAVETLIPARRSVVKMYLAGYAREEIADLLGWSEPKTRNLLYRGLADLREALTAMGIGPETLG